jgi:hypothetical protein
VPFKELALKIAPGIHEEKKSFHSPLVQVRNATAPQARTSGVAVSFASIDQPDRAKAARVCSSF